MDNAASLSADSHIFCVYILRVEGEERYTHEREKQSSEEKRIWKCY